MPRVICAGSLSGGAEGLTGTVPGPDGPVVGPLGESERGAPASDPGEEVALRVACEVIGCHVLDIARVHVARRDVAGRDQVAEPLRGIRLVLVVVGAAHQSHHAVP